MNNIRFCVECGAEGKVYENLCERCFLERHELVNLPEYLDVEMCKECGSFEVGRRWHKEPLERIVERMIDRKVSYEDVVENAHFKVRLSPEDEMNYSLLVEFDMFVEDLRTSKEIESKVRIKPSQCVVCTRKKSHYYEAILQIRADRRDLSNEEMDSIYEYVNERVNATSDAFISYEDRVHSGWDFHLSSKSLAKSIAKELASRHGAQESSSVKLVGMKDGQALYRVTYSVRLPQYRVGDIISHEGSLYQVMRMATNVIAVDLEDWKVHTFTPSELIESEVENSFRMEAVLLAQTEDEIQIMDPETMKTITLKKPDGFQPRGEEISIVKCEKGVFLSPTQKD